MAGTGCACWILTSDLQVMSLASLRCSNAHMTIIPHPSQIFFVSTQPRFLIPRPAQVLAREYRMASRASRHSERGM
jgi:hypothetical protein